jgi:membrane protease YdiL (CAAX protease family)
MAAVGNKAGRWSALAHVLLFMLGCALLLAILSPLASHISPQWGAALVGLAASLATLVLTFIFTRWDGIRFADVGALPTRGSLPRLLLGFMVGLLLVAAQTVLFTIAEHVHWVRTGLPDARPILIALVTYFLLASREELAFRGYPLRRLNQWFGPWTAQLVVALVFALEHRAGGYSWTNAIFGAFAGSLLFGMAALATRGLAVPIGLHAAWNFGQWSLGEKELPGLWKPMIPGGPSPRADHVALIAYVVVFSLATLAFWLSGETRSSRGR